MQRKHWRSEMSQTSWPASVLAKSFKSIPKLQITIRRKSFLFYQTPRKPNQDQWAKFKRKCSKFEPRLETSTATHPSSQIDLKYLFLVCLFRLLQSKLLNVPSEQVSDDFWSKLIYAFGFQIASCPFVACHNQSHETRKPVLEEFQLSICVRWNKQNCIFCTLRPKQSRQTGLPVIGVWKCPVQDYRSLLQGWTCCVWSDISTFNCWSDSWYCSGEKYINMEDSLFASNVCY